METPVNWFLEDYKRLVEDFKSNQNARRMQLLEQARNRSQTLLNTLRATTHEAAFRLLQMATVEVSTIDDIDQVVESDWAPIVVRLENCAPIFVNPESTVESIRWMIDLDSGLIECGNASHAVFVAAPKDGKL